MFKPGQSENPSGRPKSDKTVRDLAKIHNLLLDKWGAAQ